MAKLILETEYGMRVIRDDLPEDVKNDDIFPVTSFSYFVPFKKTAKQLNLDGLAWSKAVQKYSRHYARTEEEAILLFNEIIEDANAYLKTVIENNTDCKLISL